MADIPSITLKCGCLPHEHVQPMTETEMQKEIETNYQEASHREWMAHTDPQGYGYLYVCYWEYDLENVKEPFKTQKLQDWIDNNHDLHCCRFRHRNIIIATTLDTE